MILSIVDLPPPLGPSTPIREDASTSRSSPLRIARPPKDFLRPRAASCGTDGDDMGLSVVIRRVRGNAGGRTAVGRAALDRRCRRGSSALGFRLARGG